jgi:hypothetical protein
VAFTGGWYGPPDQLVPIGGSDPAPPDLNTGAADHPTDPLAADDFWGEGSASLHEAVAAPAPRAVPEPRVPAATGEIPELPAPADSGSIPVPPVPAGWLMRVPPRARLVAASCAAAASLAVSLSVLGPSSAGAGHRGTPARPSQLIANVTPQGDGFLAVTAALIDRLGADRSRRTRSAVERGRSRHRERSGRAGGRRAARAGRRAHASAAGVRSASSVSTHQAAPSVAGATSSPAGSTHTPTTTSSQPAQNPASLLGPGSCACE